jgi:hypothetical protein
MAHHELKTLVEMDPLVPIIRVAREFNAPPYKVFEPTPILYCSPNGMLLSVRRSQSTTTTARPGVPTDTS